MSHHSCFQFPPSSLLSKAPETWVPWAFRGSCSRNYLPLSQLCPGSSLPVPLLHNSVFTLTWPGELHFLSRIHSIHMNLNHSPPEAGLPRRNRCSMCHVSQKSQSLSPGPGRKHTTNSSELTGTVVMKNLFRKLCVRME